MVNYYKTLCLLILCVLCAHTAMAKVTAKLSRTAISETQSVVLTITAEGKAGNARPDISHVAKLFDVHGPSQSKQNSWINGRSYSAVTWTYQLIPKTTGTLTIPPITVGIERSNQLMLLVRKGGNDPSQGKTDPIFVEMSTENKDVYVQEEFILSIRINTTIDGITIQSIGLNIPDSDYQQLSNKEYIRKINGVPYRTIDVFVAVTPQKSGTLNIPRANVQVLKPDDRRRGFFGMGGSIREHLRSNPLTVTVKPTPQGHVGTWLPAKSLALSQRWSKDLDDLKVGDSITRTIIARAEGLGAKQLPDIAIPTKPAYKIYPDKPNFADKKTVNGIIGTRTDTVAIVLTQPGTIELPPINIPWFDTISQTSKIATLPALSLTVKGSITPTPPMATTPQPMPNVAMPADTTADQPDETSPPSALSDHPPLWPWQVACGALSICCLLFFTLWLWAKNAHNNTPTEPSLTELQHNKAHDAYHALTQACQAQDNWQVRRALVHWARLTWPTANIRALADIQRTIQPSWADQLRTLDQGRLTSDGWQSLKQAIAQDHDRLNGKGRLESLGPLYPTH